MSLEEAAQALGRSVRTIQRMAADGRLKAETRDGRTIVMVDAPATVSAGAVREGMEATQRVAALAAVTGERAALAYQERAEELERRVTEERQAARWWRHGALVAAGVAVASGVTLAATWARAAATRDIVTATEARAATAERALERAETAMAKLEGDRDRLTAIVAEVTRRDIVAQIDAALCAD
jgi:excisionase family DNA binding protein